MALLFIAQCVWYILPAYLANMAPLLVASVMKQTYAFPLDFHRTRRGRPILGAHKTWRGLVAGILTALAVSWVQSRLYSNPLFTTLSVLRYDQVDPLWWGLLMGLGALGGDAVKSFFKRRYDMAPGQSWKPFDQVDFVIGALALSSVAFTPPWSFYAGILVVMPVVKVLGGRVGYALGLRPTKW